MATRLAYTVAEAAELLGVSPDLVRSEARKGTIATFTFGGRVLVADHELRRIAGATPATELDAATILEALAGLAADRLAAEQGPQLRSAG